MLRLSQHTQRHTEAHRGTHTHTHTHTHIHTHTHTQRHTYTHARTHTHTHIHTHNTHIHKPMSCDPNVTCTTNAVYYLTFIMDTLDCINNTKDFSKCYIHTLTLNTHDNSIGILHVLSSKDNNTLSIFGRWHIILPAHSNYCIPCVCCHPGSDSLQKKLWCALISTDM